MKLDSKDLEFAVIHVGPRLHYAVPAVLEEAGMLRVLYTDAHAACGALAPLKLLPGRFQSKGIRRLLSRTIPDTIPARKVRGWLYPSLQIEWLNRMVPNQRKNARYWQEQGIGGHWLARKAIDDNFSGADALYVHPCVSTGAVREAKRRGMFVVIEAISHPFNKLVEKGEYERFGHSSPEPESELRDNIDFFKTEAQAADLVLAASPYVADGLTELGLAPEKLAIVPYGLDPAFSASEPEPVPGRVLYVGNIGYLKGVPYYAEAARILKSSDPALEFRAVGPFQNEMIERPEFRGPHYVGQVPRAEVREEFRTADVFVFPSLSDGFGIVLLEAMAAGVPVICTPNCAALVRDGENGFVVPARDAGLLAQRISQITGDRALRSRLGAAARETAKAHTLADYRRNLLLALNKTPAV